MKPRGLQAKTIANAQRGINWGLIGTRRRIFSRVASNPILCRKIAVGIRKPETRAYFELLAGKELNATERDALIAVFMGTATPVDERRVNQHIERKTNELIVQRKIGEVMAKYM
jgi:hypothetical protein